jgi:hypothetical protein
MDGTFDMGDDNDGGVLIGVGIIFRTFVKVVGALVFSWGAVKISQRNLAFLLGNIEKRCEKEE